MIRDLINITESEINQSAEQATNFILNCFYSRDLCDKYSNKVSETFTMQDENTDNKVKAKKAKSGRNWRS